MSSRTHRLAALLVPSPLSVVITLPDRPFVLRAAQGLALLWVAMAIALAAQLVAGARARVDNGEYEPPSARIDLLTATGASMVWGGSIALIGSQLLGWASLAVVGTLGIGAVYLAVIWTVAVAGGDRPWRRATFERAVLPTRTTEGEPLRDEFRIAGVVIPGGMRLFVEGRAFGRGPSTRHVIEADRSRAQLELTSELGPAVRGEHRAPPLALWLGDVLGLTRTPIVRRCPTAFTVVPCITTIDDPGRVLGPGGDDATTVPSRQLPTEGTFRIREYVPGDDARRIHWIRSLQQEQLVVRLPDEVPCAEQTVRLILDNELGGTDGVTSRAPDELLDGIVRVWISLGVALAARGIRVTLVTAASRNNAVARIECPVIARAPKAALQLGASVAWQTQVSLEALVAANPRGARSIVVSGRPRKVVDDPKLGWVIVPELSWVAGEPPLRIDRPFRFGFPSGSPENRRGRRKREHDRITTLWTDRLVFSHLTTWTVWPELSGSHVAQPKGDRIALRVIR